MYSKDIKIRLKRLREQIDDLRYRYHVKNDPDVTDKMYEGLMDELRKLESKNPDLVTSDSPTQRVAGKPIEKFEKITHSVPQWSFNDAFDSNDLADWEERLLKILEKKLGHRPSDLTYTAELKIDGLHMVLTYISGELKSAATRGDGLVGENVTQNAKAIHSVPLRLNKKIDIVAEGEVWLGSSMLKKINSDRAKAGLTLYANPRNVAAGTIRQLDSKIVSERKLSLTAYDISGGGIPDSQAIELDKLKLLGFKTDNNWKVCKNISEIESFWKKWEKKKDTQPFWIDGVVVKVNQKKYQEMLGYTGKAPRWALALKFAAEQGTTKIKDVYVQVGRTGALTPVAHMEPVKLAGTTVTHATLHNFDEIVRLGVRVGDTVVVEKAGDIIPKVVKVLEKMRTGREKKISEPKKCPICGEKVERREILDKKQQGSAALFCTNSKCYAQELERIIHFVSKKAFNIDGLGKKIVEQLVNEGLIKNPADLFNLTVGDLAPLERFADKSAENLIEAIAGAKKVTFARFIFGLGIPHVGEETAIALASNFATLNKLMSATQEDLEQINDVGPRVAESIRTYFTDKDNKSLISELLDSGVFIEKKQKLVLSRQSLVGKTFVLTGAMKNLTRDEVKEKIRALGGNVSGSVSGFTNYVVAGENPGSKLIKAKEQGVKILNESEFLKLTK